jgi:type I restriction enzyme R subunit
MLPEQLARQKIDKKLEQAGWLVQDYKSFNPSAGSGIAVREYPVESGKVDYLLFIDRKPIGVIEAKKEGVTLSGVHEQTQRYGEGTLKHIIKKENLPFQYESTEIEARFSVADKLEQTIDENLEKANSLRQSILKRAFEGRLI